MSRYNDMSDSDRRREERHEYERQVVYDVWRSGRDPDRVNPDRVSDHYYRGDSAESAANHEIRLQRQAEERRMEEQMDYERQLQEEYERQQFEAEATAQQEAALQQAEAAQIVEKPKEDVPF